MADPEGSNIQLLKSTHISVFVDEALPDILVVTYESGVKVFKGVLLDSNKRNPPCGIPSLNPTFKIPPTKIEEDVLYSVNQRFAYTDKQKRKNIRFPSKYKNGKMTVRLRPRQVLCTKCKSICSENSENVSTRKRKSSESVHIVSPPKRGLNAPITRSVYSELNNQKGKLVRQATLVPRLTRLTPQEENSVMERLRQAKKPLITSNGNEENTKEAGDQSGMRVLRKKRSIGSMEDLWDETVFEENTAHTKTPKSEGEKDEGAEQIVKANTTRTIKISYGPQGEGTVLKIPSQKPSSSTSENRIDVGKVESDNKATRKALRKAKKEAKRRVFLTPTSPRYSISGSSPRYTVGSASPRHGLGNNSPRYVYDFSIPRRRKHKVKHKKRHKEERDKRHNRGEGEVSSTQDEHVVTQKLSINLKRLNDIYSSYPTFDENTSSSEEQCERVPDFPQSDPPLMLRINSQTISSAPSSTGSRIVVGEVVWGKIQGFPWWPAKILTMTSANQAYVTWYGSSTSSLIPCDQLSPYLENFKVRYNKKKKGMYKEAIKRATLEAKKCAELCVQIVKKSPQHPASIVPVVVPPAMASPREIDVVS